MIRKIIALGKYSAVMVLPKELLRKLGWKRGQKVVVSAKRKSLRVLDYKKRN